MKTKDLNTTTLGSAAMLILCGLASTSLAGDEAVETKSSGILPLPDYSGDFLERSYLLGDLGGLRIEWAEKGFTFDVDYNQYFQSVLDGGLDTGSGYGATIDYDINVDFDRMGLIPGGLLSMRSVSRYGNSVNGKSGTLVPVNTYATYPTTANPDDSVGLWLPVINYTQFLSEKFAVGFGKYDTLDSPNEFSGGRGQSQYWNQNLIMPLSPLLIVPNVTTAGTAVWMPNPNLQVTGMVGTITDTSNTSGFDDFDDGLFGMLMLTYQYKLAELPGGLVFMPGYGWGRDFTEINPRINIVDGQFAPSTEDDTWFVSLEAWQYLWTEGVGDQPVDINNGRQDLEGVGVFARLQFADADTNPMDFSISGGINAKGLIPGRDNDAMGIAYAYNSLETGRFFDALGIADSSSVLEAFYNVELTPAVHLTLNTQLADSPLPNVDTAVILGTSLQIQF